MIIILCSLFYVAMILYYAVKRGSAGKSNLLTLYTGLIPFALFAAALCAYSGDGFVSCIMLVTALVATAEAARMYELTFEPNKLESDVIGYIEMFLGEEAHLSPSERRFFVRAMRHARSLIEKHGETEVAAKTTIAWTLQQSKSSALRIIGVNYLTVFP